MSDNPSIVLFSGTDDRLHAAATIVAGAAAMGMPSRRMTTLVDTGLLSDLQRCGAADASACFGRATCAASCPLVSDDASVARCIIHYAQVGMRDFFEALGREQSGSVDREA